MVVEIYLIAFKKLIFNSLQRNTADDVKNYWNNKTKTKTDVIIGIVMFHSINVILSLPWILVWNKIIPMNLRIFKIVQHVLVTHMQQQT